MVRRVDAPNALIVATKHACAELSRECLLSHGEEPQRVEARQLNRFGDPLDPCNGRRDDGFLVKNYTFGAPGLPGHLPPCPEYPYPLNDPCGPDIWQPHQIKAHDAHGVPGQDSGNPASFFGFHWVVRVDNDRWYDPSYGTGPWITNDDGIVAEQWENASVAGYWSEIVAIGPIGVIKYSARPRGQGQLGIKFDTVFWE